MTRRTRSIWRARSAGGGVRTSWHRRRRSRCTGAASLVWWPRRKRWTRRGDRPRWVSVLLAGGQGAAAVAGGFEGSDEGGSYAVVLEFADGVDGGARRGGDVLAELHRVLAAVAEHRRGTDRGLDDQVVGLVA